MRNILMNYHIAVLVLLEFEHPEKSKGNPRDYFVKDEAIINRMGFNNDGVVVAIDHLKKARENGVIVGGYWKE